MARVLFVFMDGIGLGEPSADVNPLMAARMPVLLELLGDRRPVRDAAPLHTAGASLAALDATLDVPGTPQSGTGQAALLTGRNAARIFGRHFGPWTPTSLRPLLREESVLMRAVRAGHDVAFANAYPEEAVQAVAAATRAERRARRALPAGARPPMPRAALRAAPPLAAAAAGLLTRHTAALARGQAVASELTNESWRTVLGRRNVPVIDAAAAGRNLGRIAAGHDLTFFAHYTTDIVGHGGDFTEAVSALERLDRFVGGVLDALPRDALLLVASDHGNIEDVRVGHTRNPALGLIVGDGHERVARRLRSLTDVAPAILDRLDE